MYKPFRSSLFTLTSLALLATACAATQTEEAEGETTGSTEQAIGCADCPPPVEPGESCKSPIPKPANLFQTQCNATNARCVESIPPDVCDKYNTDALNKKLIDKEAHTWVSKNGRCVVVFNNRIEAICVRGCFEAETEIVTNVRGGEPSFTPAQNIEVGDRIMSLQGRTRPQAARFQAREVAMVTSGPETTKLFVFRLANGRALKVTEHHPMVLVNGTIVPAHKVTTSDVFIGVDGAKVPIASIERELSDKDVFNFSTNAASRIGHVIAAEGVLVGDLRLQHEVEREELEIEMRQSGGS